MRSDVLALRAGWTRKVAAVLVQSCRAQWIFFVIPLAYLASNAWLLSSLDDHGRAPVHQLLVSLLTFSLPVGLVTLLLIRLLQFALVEKPASPVRALAGEVFDLFRHPARIVNAIPVLAAMILFNKAMVELKPAIPKINPFSWDLTLMSWDRMLHFGADPWVLLQPIMGFAPVTFLANVAYNFWFVALFGAWCWFGFRDRASALRTRFFLSYMLAWFLGGGLLAVWFSSAGPVYFDELGLRPDPYVGLFAYLHDVDRHLPLWFLKTQQLLWDGYAGRVPALGISAFPSMHNASATLFALTFWRVSRPLGIFFTAYAAIILVASVHTGWHYAIDGYAGILLALVCWWACGPIARWYASRPATRAYNESLASL